MTTIDIGYVHTLEPCDCDATLHPEPHEAARRLNAGHYRCRAGCPHPDHQETRNG